MWALEHVAPNGAKTLAGMRCYKHVTPPEWEFGILVIPVIFSLWRSEARCLIRPK